MARNEPAFRVNALAALSAMDDVMAYDALRSLLEVKQCRNPLRRVPRAVGDERARPVPARRKSVATSSTTTCSMCRARTWSTSRKAICRKSCCSARISSSRLPLMLDAGKNILVNGMKGDKITVSRFASQS